MLPYILAGIAALILLLVVVVAMQPAAFRIERSAAMAAPPSAAFALVNDFHRWPSWSPWEDLDPDLQRTYSGAETGVGSHYAWSGNRKAGRGSMEITSSTPDEIGLVVGFLKPVKATNQTAFMLAPSGHGTQVTWRMAGEQTGLMAVFGKFVSMDKLIGKDFEKGLAQLKAAAESPS